MQAGTVEIAGSPVGRIALSLAGLRTTGMWGEPLGRSDASACIHRAVDLGIGLVEVPVPFGPWADLLRDADPDPDRLILALLLTGREPARDLDVARRRLGAEMAGRVAIVLARPDRLGAARAAAWTAVGAWLAEPAEWPEGPLAAVRASHGDEATVGRCDAGGIPFLSNDPRVLKAGTLTVAVLEPRSSGELDRLYSEAVTPPGATPG